MARTNRLLTPKERAPNGEVGAKPAKRPSQADAGGWTNRKWHEAERILAAYYAGQGWRPDAVAYALGGTNGPAVRIMLGRYGVSFLAHGATRDAIMLQWKATDRAALDAAALRRDRDPAELAALIVRKVLAGGDRAIDAIVDEYDVIG